MLPGKDRTLWGMQVGILDYDIAQCETKDELKRLMFHLMRDMLKQLCVACTRERLVPSELNWAEINERGMCFTLECAVLTPAETTH